MGVIVEDWMMDMLSIDESDAIYQSFRSVTTMGLEIGSLVAGGYGTLRGVMALKKLTKTPMQVAKITNQAMKPSLKKIDTAMKAIEDFLGGKARVITNTDGDMILMRGDKKIRFDIINRGGKQVTQAA